MTSSCGACKFLRRKCATECIFAPYFCYEQAAIHFSAVHKVFGASNVSKLLLHLPVQDRSVAAMTVSYEALARMHDPVYGCVAHVIMLQQQVAQLEKEIQMLEKQMARKWYDTAYGCCASASPGSCNDFSGLEVDMNVQGRYDNAQQNPLMHSTGTLGEATSEQMWDDTTWLPSPDPMNHQEDILMYCAAESLVELI